MLLGQAELDRERIGVHACYGVAVGAGALGAGKVGRAVAVGTGVTVAKGVALGTGVG